MKRALYFAIRTGSLYKQVVAVTSEKRHRWYGREVRDDMPTNGTLDQLKGRFDNVEDALKMREAIGKLSDSYDEVRKLLSQESSQLYRRENRAMERLLAGEQSGPIPAVTQVHKIWIASHNQEWVASGGRRSLSTSSNTSQMAGACARAAEDIDPKAGGFIIVRPEPEEVVR